MKKGLAFILFLANSWLCFSQNANIDSLLLALSSSNADTTKVKILNNLFVEYEYTNAEKARESLEKALALAQKNSFRQGLIMTYKNFGFLSEDVGNYEEALKNYTAGLKVSESIGDKQGQLSAFNNMGIIYVNQSNYPQALKNYFLCLKLSKETKNKKGIARSYNNIGNVYRLQGNYPEALKNHFASLKMNESLGDHMGISASYNNIGMIYKAQKNYKEALKNYTASLKINEAMEDKRSIAASYNNIANVHEELANYDEALKNHFISLRIRQEISDNKEIAGSYSNIGNVYYFQGNYREALKNYMASLKIANELGNVDVSTGNYNNIGEVYLKQKKYNEARESFQKAKALAGSIGHKEYLRNAYIGLTNYYEVVGNFQQAFETHKLYILYRDSLNNEETRKQTIQSQMTFDFEKKEAVAIIEHKKELENQQMLAEAKSRKQKVVIGLVALGLLIVVIFAGFVFRSLRITKKQKRVIEMQKHQVEQQKKEVEVQKHIVEEHQKDIIDSITYAKRLQRAILPSDEEIKKFLPDSFILYKPKDIVAGDFYWLEYKKDIIFIAAADSTGHGVPGAMVSVVCSNALNRAVNEFNLLETGQILDKTRELVLETFAKSGEEIKDGMDISLLAIHREKNMVYWSGANNQLWYMRSGQYMMLEIKPDKQPIGKTENPKPFTTHSIDLNKGDTFYLLTDGYADQFGGEKGKKFKYKQLQEKLLAHSHASPEEQKEYLEQAFEVWKGSLEQVDDVTIIGITV